MDLNYYKVFIENALDIKNCLFVHNDKIIPNKQILTKKYIKDNLLDDLFSFHFKRLHYSHRFLRLVGEITDRQVLCGNFYLEKREA